MSSQNNDEYRDSHHSHSSSSSHHHSSGSHHSSDSGSHHSSGASSHHSSGSSSHHSTGSSSHHSSGISSHHSSGSSSHHSSGSSSHRSSGSSSHHSSSSSSNHHSSSGSSSGRLSSKEKRSSNYYYTPNSFGRMTPEQAQAKIDKLGEKYSEISTQSDIQKREIKPGKPVVKKKKNTAAKIILGIIIFILCLALVASVALFLMVESGKKNLLNNDTDIKTPEQAETQDDGKTVRYNGKIYKLDENITSIACLGVDKKEINQNGVVGSSGQADTIMIIAFDTLSGSASVIPIPRDTVAEIDVYASDGSFLRNEKTQICLSYAYGDGGKTSCENTVSAVRKLMFGLPINSYAALDLEGIAVLNDTVGGVTVTPEESFASFKKGETVLLKGDEAMSFVRYRDTSKVDSNLNRMNRQLQYVKSFTSSAVGKVKSNLSSITDIYNTAMDYAYTSINLSDATYLATRFISGSGRGTFETYSVPGKMVEGDDGYSEYYVDETAFYELVLSVYYDVIGTY